MGDEVTMAQRALMDSESWAKWDRDTKIKAMTALRRKEVEMVKPTPEYLEPPMKEEVSRFAHTALPLAGATIASAAGVPIELGTALVSGPAAPITTPVVAAGIAGLGAAAGEFVADVGDWLFDVDKKEEQRGYTEEFAVGAGLELAARAALGTAGKFAQIVAEPTKKAGKFLWRLVPTKGNIEKIAAEKYIAYHKNNPWIADSLKEAKKLEEEIPGLKFHYGSDVLDDAQLKSIAEGNEKAIKDYHKKSLGKEGSEEYLSRVESKQERLGLIKQRGGARQEREIGRVKAKAPDQISDPILEKTRAAKRARSKAIGEMYEEIPTDIELDTEFLKKDVGVIKNEMSKWEDPADVPSIIGKFADEAPDEMSFGELRKLRTAIKNRIRNPATSPASKERLGRFVDRIEETTDQILDHKRSNIMATERGRRAHKKYKEASTEWKKYRETYSEGRVGKVLKGGKAGEGLAMESERIPQALFRPGGSKSFSKIEDAMGAGEARQSAQDYADYTLAKKSEGGLSLKTLNKWKHENRGLLDHFNLRGRYKSLEEATRVAEASASKVKEFEKTIFSRFLKENPDDMFKIAYSKEGSRDLVKTTQKLKSIAAKSPEAKRGLENHFGDFISNELSTLVKKKVDPAEIMNAYNKMMPSIKEMYEDAPGKVKVLEKIHEAYAMLAREGTSPLGGKVAISRVYLAMFNRVPYAGNIRMATDLFKGHTDEAVNKVLVRAVSDPEYGKALEAIGRGKVKNKRAQLKLLITRAAAYSVEETTQRYKEFKEARGTK